MSRAEFNRDARDAPLLDYSPHAAGVRVSFRTPQPRSAVCPDRARPSPLGGGTDEQTVTKRPTERRSAEVDCGPLVGASWRATTARFDKPRRSSCQQPHVSAPLVCARGQTSRCPLPRHSCAGLAVVKVCKVADDGSRCGCVRLYTVPTAPSLASCGDRTRIKNCSRAARGRHESEEITRKKENQNDGHP